MTAVHPTLHGRVVGDLACQRDSYLQTLNTEVISCVKWSAPKGAPKRSKTPTFATPDLWLIECAHSVLFPEGGGQPSDQGTLMPLSTSSESIPIAYVQRDGLRCIHYSPKPLSPGTAVRQQIDFRRRWDHMQQHTGQHVLSAIMDTYENLETLGWGMGVEGEMNYVDLPRIPRQEEIQTIQDRCNEIIRENQSIVVETPEDAKDDSLPSDYNKEMGVIRVIKIGDLDRNTCCGTHLSQTSHLSLLLLHHTQPIHSTNTRLYFTAGNRAITLSTTSIHTLRTIAKNLSSGNTPDEILSTVKKTSETNTALRRKEKKLLSDIAVYESQRVKTILQTGHAAWVYRATEGLDFLNMVIFELKDVVKEHRLVVLAAGEEKNGGPLVLFGDKDSVDAFILKIKHVLPGIKGGGKGERWQGKVTEWKKGELEALKTLVESET